MGVSRLLLAAACLAVAAPAVIAAPAPAASPAAAPAAAAEPWDLTILHINDNHARFMPADYGFSANCEGDKGDACFGGMARQATVLNAQRAAAADRGVDTLTIHAGDQFSGTVWDDVFVRKDVQIAPRLLKDLGIQAFVPGNHEFDNGIGILAHFLGNLTKEGIPVLSCNLDTSGEPSLDGLIKDYTIVQLPISKRKVGIVGLTTTTAPETSDGTGAVGFLPFNETLPGCIAAARADGAEVIVLANHIGIKEDLVLAEQPWAADVDVIVGGHSHTFMTGAAAMDDTEQKPGEQPVILLDGRKEAVDALGPYPTWVQREGAPPLPIVQALWASRYVGALNVTFEGSDVRAANGSLILLGGKNSTAPVAEDPEMAARLAELQPQVDAMADEVLGELTTLLMGPGEGASVRIRPTNLGAVTCSAFLDYVVNKTAIIANYPGAPVVCLMNSGGIRANVQPDPRITRGDMATTFPMSNEVVVKAMNASTVMAALAHSADSWTGLTDSVGVYLQQGRLRYGFDASVPTGRGQRVVKAEIQPAPEKGKPADPADPWQPLESYPGNIVVVGSDYMLKGGDGYDMFEGVPMSLDKDMRIDVVVGDWLRDNSPLTWPDKRPEDLALSVNCADAASSAGSTLCVRSAEATAAPAAAPASAAAGVASPALAAALTAVLAACSAMLV